MAAYINWRLGIGSESYFELNRQTAKLIQVDLKIDARCELITSDELITHLDVARDYHHGIWSELIKNNKI